MLDLEKPKNLFHSRVLNDFLQAPSFRKALDASTLAKLQVDATRLKHFSSAKIDRRDFQKRAVQSACKEISGLWCGELWTGAGKSIIAALIALHFLKRGGKVVFICPNKMGIGHRLEGIIKKFHDTFAAFAPAGVHYKIGSLDNLTRLDDVHFLTPRAFVRLSRTESALFKKITGEASILIVDEAHHFPEDPQEDQVIYGKIERLASEHFLGREKKVVTLTATHGRHDGKPVFKKFAPDFRITVNEAVQNGWCPEIHGLPVYLNTRAPKSMQHGSEYYLNLSKKEAVSYLRQVAAVMIEVQKANPGQQFCAFVRTIAEATKLAEIWNHEATRFNFPPVALLVGTVPVPERLEIQAKLRNREFVGYITCDVGSESIDIPRIETVHLIRRTRSLNRLVQSIGRALRNHPEKRRTLIVDYHVLERKIIRACQGLETYATYVESTAKKLVSGGPIVPLEGSKNADFQGISISEERKWVERLIADEHKKGLEKDLGIPGAFDSGKEYGWLTILEHQDFSNVYCVCRCGNFYISRRDRLLSGDSVSCGCYKKTAAFVAPGTRFGNLVVLRYDNPFKVYCQCDCGKTTTTSKGCLTRGNTKSCGHLKEPHGPMRKGQRINSLVVQEDLGCMKVKCLCDCGKEVITNRANLRDSKAHCICWKAGKPITSGSIFGFLKVLEDKGTSHVQCVCVCGKKVVLPRYRLRTTAKSCGCKKPFSPKIKRGTIFTWLKVIEDIRCDNVRCVCRCGKEIVALRSALAQNQRKSCGCRGATEPLKTGAEYNSLTVVSDEGYEKVHCKCKCGKLLTLRRSRITLGSNKSCGCRLLGTPLKPGSRFGRLVVLEDRGAKKVLCQCDCNKIAVTKSRAQLRFSVKSCGCLTRKRLPKTRAGQVFGSWTVIGDWDRKAVHCQCVCGTKKTVNKSHLYSGISKSCGCLNACPRIKEGTVFGDLTVISDSGYGVRGDGRQVKCKCFCGNERLIGPALLIGGHYTSCGCRRKSADMIKPGTRFGMLTVIQDKGHNEVHCACDCGNKVVLRRATFVAKLKKSCGCFYTTQKRLKVGSCYGDWTVIGDTGCREVKARCSCGFVKNDHLRQNLTKGSSKRCSNCALKANTVRLVAMNKAKSIGLVGNKVS